jgi:uncharacterized membrane protein
MVARASWRRAVPFGTGEIVMGLLALGLAVFVAVHLISSFRVTRAALIARYGEGAYKGVFSLLSAGGFVLIVWGMKVADFVPVWEPPAWGRDAALWIMPLAFILLAGAFIPSNLKRLTAHPMLWGITLWAALHLLANGDFASMLLFGTLLIYSLYAMWAQSQRGAVPADTVRALSRDVTVVIAGLIVYTLFLYAHAWLFGIAVI